MEIMKIVCIAFTGVAAASLIKAVKPELSVYVSLAAVMLILLFVLAKLDSVFQFLKTVYDQISYGKEYFPIIIKVLVVAYLTDFTAQLCKDAKEGAIGNKVELAGKVIIFYLSMPVLLSVLDLVNSIL